MAATKKSESKRTPRDYSGMQRGAFGHPEDRRAMAALDKVPGIHWAMRQLSRHSYEKVMRLSLTAKSVQAGPRSFRRLHELLVEACQSLDVPVPELFVRQDRTPAVTTIGPDRPLTIIAAELLGLLEEEEMLCLMAQQASHIHCDHLSYLMVCDFVRDMGQRLGLVGAPLLGPQIALEEWRRRAELSCDRGALLVSGDLGIMQRLLAKLAAGGETRFGSVDIEALAEQEKAFLEGTKGVSLGRLYRGVMYLDTASAFAALRVAELGRWAQSNTYKALVAGAYAEAEVSAQSEQQRPPLWGEFAGEAHVCPTCGQQAKRRPAVTDGIPHQVFDGLRQAAGSAADLAQQGATAFMRAVGTFFESLQEKEVDGEGNESPAVKIPVCGEE